MKSVLEEISKMKFSTGANFEYQLEEEYKIISAYLNKEDQMSLKSDFERFFEKGRFLILNTFSGGLLFLKESEEIDKIIIESKSEDNNIKASIIFKSNKRNPENIKYKPDAAKTENTKWDIRLIFPNYFNYEESIQNALLLIIGKIVKRICEYGRVNFAYMKIKNEFPIEILMDTKLKSKLRIEIK
ncbi:MAG: hypothetical protein R2828_25600 [Saprospiraceae bacterium]